MDKILTSLRIYKTFLSRNKVYTLVSILGFSISLMFVILIGVYVQQELSVDNFHSKKDRIKTIVSDDGVTSFGVVADYVKDMCPEVEDYVRIYYDRANIYSKTDENYNAHAMFADASFFSIFDFYLEDGNSATALKMKSSVVLSKNLAQKEFGNENPIGKTLKIDNIDYLITGVFKNFPKNTQFKQPDLIFSYQSLSNYVPEKILNSWNNAAYQIFFLEKPGTSLLNKRAEILEGFKKDNWLYNPTDEDSDKIVDFLTLEELYFSTIDVYDIRGTLKNDLTTVTIYLSIAILILIVAIFNYINMAVAQTGLRGKESAIKRLMGANRSSIVVQNLMESVIMVAITFAIGILFANISKPFFEGMLDTQLYLSDYFSTKYFILSILFILIIGTIAGFAPAILASNFEPIEVVKGEYTRKLKSSYSKIFVTLQYIISIVLIITSLFIVQQSNFLRSYDIGLNKNQVLEIKNNNISAKTAEGFRDKLMQISGVEVVSFTMGSPLDGGNNNTINHDGQKLSFQIFTVDTAFHNLFDMQVEYTGMHKTDGIIINRTGFNALHIDTTSYSSSFGGKNRINIAGICEDFHFRPLTTAVGPAVIRAYTFKYKPWSILVSVSKGNDVISTRKEIERTYKEYTGGGVFEAKFVDETIEQWYVNEDRLAKLMSSFSFFTIIITIMGVFAMSLYTVQQREKEIGIRKVNGATEYEILKLLNIDSLRLIIVAFVVACPIAYYIASEWLQRFAYKIAINPLIFIIVGAFILVLTLLCISITTWKAAKSNPIDILKKE